MEHFREYIKKLLATYYKEEEHFDINLLKLSDADSLVIIMEELSNL